MCTVQEKNTVRTLFLKQHPADFCFPPQSVRQTTVQKLTFDEKICVLPAAFFSPLIFHLKVYDLTLQKIKIKTAQRSSFLALL